MQAAVPATAAHTHQEAGLVGLDALLQRLLNVDGPADAVLRGPQRQLDLRTVSLLLIVCCNVPSRQSLTGREASDRLQKLAAAVLSLSCRQKQRHVDSKHTVACIQQQSGGAPEHEVHQVAAIVTQLACK